MEFFYIDLDGGGEITMLVSEDGPPDILTDDEGLAAIAPLFSAAYDMDGHPVGINDLTPETVNHILSLNRVSFSTTYEVEEREEFPEGVVS